MGFGLGVDGSDPEGLALDDMAEGGGLAAGVLEFALCGACNAELSCAATDKPARQTTARPIDDPAKLNRRMLRHAPIPLTAATDSAVQATKTNAFSSSVDAGRNVNPAVRSPPRTPVAMPVTTLTLSVRRVTSSPWWVGGAGSLEDSVDRGDDGLICLPNN